MAKRRTVITGDGMVVETPTPEPEPEEPIHTIEPEELITPADNIPEMASEPLGPDTPVPTPTPEPEPAPAPQPTPKETVHEAVVRVMETASDDHSSGTLVEYADTRTWVFIDIDGPTVERAIREARKVDPDVTVARVIAHVTGWAHDSGRLYRTVTKLRA